MASATLLLIAKNNTLRKSGAPWSTFFFPGSAFLPPGLFCSGALFFASIKPRRLGLSAVGGLGSGLVTVLYVVGLKIANYFWGGNDGQAPAPTARRGGVETAGDCREQLEPRSDLNLDQSHPPDKTNRTTTLCSALMHQHPKQIILSVKASSNATWSRLGHRRQ